ncbi:O-antigen ligase family protein [Pseudonocardia sp. EV170527-09]|uniref:O-antigen ligase family protein n=1 Tax=Pseudonocardia sp. EV170527-09 TaxID=2603411 RepID=UPI0011F374F2|nr:O-antigen ligase family protein [Pseudonocardia sp. EV170527-09]KAA1017470.1 O-antigen ligase family protein [Pseudonocardia sp. EV170527-09]
MTGPDPRTGTAAARVGELLLAAAVLSAPWNALGWSPFKPAPLLLAAACLALAVDACLRCRPLVVPAWVWPLSAAIALATVTSVLFHPTGAYLAGRYLPDHVPSAEELGAAPVLGLVAGLQWLVAAFALPVAVCVAAPGRPQLIGRLCAAWLLGASVNALVAVGDATGLTSISANLIDAVDVGGRQTGLSVQPNHLAVASALALPLAVHRTLHGRHRGAALLCIAALVGGLVVAQSRGGTVLAVLGTLAVLVTDRWARVRLLGPGLLVAAAGLVTVLVAGDRLPTVASQLRITGSASAEASDSIRASILQQAVDDARHSPVTGVGLAVLPQGHSIWVQLVAAGGVLLLVGFVLSAAGMLADAHALRGRYDGLSLALGVSVAAWLVGGLVENQLADLYLYTAPALLAGLHASSATPVPSGKALV